MRIYDSDGAAHDYCANCKPTLAEAKSLHQHNDFDSERGDAFLYDEEGLDTPPYAHSWGYNCAKCAVILGEND